MKPNVEIFNNNKDSESLTVVLPAASPTVRRMKGTSSLIVCDLKLKETVYNNGWESASPSSDGSGVLIIRLHTSQADQVGKDKKK